MSPFNPSRLKAETANPLTPDSTRTYYDENAETYARATQCSDLRLLWEPFEGALVHGAMVADLGCGSGRDLRRFAEAGLWPTGLDRSFFLSRIAHKFSDRPVVVGDLTALPFHSGAFDAAWCVAAILHLTPADAGRALAEIRRVLRPNGLVLLTLKEGDGNEIDEDGRRVVFYTEASARQRLIASGLVDLRVIRSTEHRGERVISWLAFIARANT